MSPVRVLIVEDSAVVQEHLRRIISADPRLTVAGIAGTGEEALEMVDRVTPDVISMDIQLPGMEGFETTRRIMAAHPTPIVVVSSLGTEEVNLTMQAFKAGALGVVEKPVAPTHAAYDAMAKRLCTQLVIMSEVRVIRRRGAGAKTVEAPAQPMAPPRQAEWLTPFRVLAVAASTGGPNALLQLLTGLGGDFPLPIVVVQHMTPGFMEGFAEWLTSVTPFAASVIRGPETLFPGHVYLAPSGHHLLLNGSTATPQDGAPVGNHRPSANVMFSSAARTCGASAIGLLLTGMGDDGAAGLVEMKNSGAYTIAEDESTAVVYGMPAAGVKLGGVRESLPLSEIAPRILALVASRRGLP
jgi:two-component system chemotaxis response regulator CheB